MAAKVMISIPDEFLAEVDRVAQEEHRSRSELVREALRLYIGQRHAAAQGSAAAQPGTASRVREAQAAYETMTDQDRGIARELRDRLTELTPLRDLVVFGSRARGDAAPDSDMDVFIELEDVTSELREQISEIAWEVGFQRDRVITTIVATRDDLQHGAMGANPLMLSIEREGVRP